MINDCRADRSSSLSSLDSLVFAESLAVPLHSTLLEDVPLGMVVVVVVRWLAWTPLVPLLVVSYFNCPFATTGDDVDVIVAPRSGALSLDASPNAIKWLAVSTVSMLLLLVSSSLSAEQALQSQQTVWLSFSSQGRRDLGYYAQKSSSLRWMTTWTHTSKTIRHNHRIRLLPLPYRNSKHRGLFSILALVTSLIPIPIISPPSHQPKNKTHKLLVPTHKQIPFTGFGSSECNPIYYLPISLNKLVFGGTSKRAV